MDKDSAAVENTVAAHQQAPSAPPADQGEQLCAEMDVYMAANRGWSQKELEKDPDFFKNLVNMQQAPAVFWIGCAESRVPVSGSARCGSGVGVSRKGGGMVRCTPVGTPAVMLSQERCPASPPLHCLPWGWSLPRCYCNFSCPPLLHLPHTLCPA
jgi:hypothetical protein